MGSASTSRLCPGTEEAESRLAGRVKHVNCSPHIASQGCTAPSLPDPSVHRSKALPARRSHSLVPHYLYVVHCTIPHCCNPDACVCEDRSQTEGHGRSKWPPQRKTSAEDRRGTTPYVNATIVSQRDIEAHRIFILPGHIVVVQVRRSRKHHRQAQAGPSRRRRPPPINPYSKQVDQYASNLSTYVPLRMHRFFFLSFLAPRGTALPRLRSSFNYVFNFLPFLDCILPLCSDIVASPINLLAIALTICDIWRI